MKTLRDYIDLVNERFDQALSEKVTLNPDGTVPPTQTVRGVTMNAPANAVQTGSGGVLKTGSGAAVTSGTPAPAPDAAAAAKAKLTPSQLKWLGGADATDPYIMARMPKPQPGEVTPGAEKAATAAQSARDDDAAVDAANPKMTAADQEDADLGAAMAANAQAAQTQAANGVNAQGQNVTMPNGINPETGEPTTVTAGAPAVAQSAQAAPAAGGKVPPQPTLGGKPSTGPKGQAWLQKYGATHNPDGTPKAAGGAPAAAPAAPAAQKPGVDASGRANAAADPRTLAGTSQAGQAAPAGAGAGRGGQGGPTAAQSAERNFNAAKDSQAANVAKEGRTARNDHAFIDELNAMRSIAGLPTRNKW